MLNDSGDGEHKDWCTLKPLRSGKRHRLSTNFVSWFDMVHNFGGRVITDIQRVIGVFAGPVQEGQWYIQQDMRLMDMVHVVRLPRHPQIISGQFT